MVCEVLFSESARLECRQLAVAVSEENYADAARSVCVIVANPHIITLANRKLFLHENTQQSVRLRHS